MNVEEREARLRDFLRRLPAAMTARGMTQSVLADEIGCARSQLNRWLRGGRTPTLESLMRIEEAYDRLVHRGR